MAYIKYTLNGREVPVQLAEGQTGAQVAESLGLAANAWTAITDVQAAKLQRLTVAEALAQFDAAELAYREAALAMARHQELSADNHAYITKRNQLRAALAAGLSGEPTIADPNKVWSAVNSQLPAWTFEAGTTDAPILTFNNSSRVLTATAANGSMSTVSIPGTVAGSVDMVSASVDGIVPKYTAGVPDNAMLFRNHSIAGGAPVWRGGQTAVKLDAVDLNTVRSAGLWYLAGSCALYPNHPPVATVYNTYAANGFGNLSANLFIVDGVTANNSFYIRQKYIFLRSAMTGASGDNVIFAGSEFVRIAIDANNWTAWSSTTGYSAVLYYGDIYTVGSSYFAIKEGASYGIAAFTKISTGVFRITLLDAFVVHGPGAGVIAESSYAPIGAPRYHVFAQYAYNDRAFTSSFVAASNTPPRTKYIDSATFEVSTFNSLGVPTDIPFCAYVKRA